MKVHWAETAEAHLDAIYSYIAQDSETYALRTVDQITRKSQQIGAFPFSGRRVPEYDLEQIREVFSSLPSLPLRAVVVKRVRVQALGFGNGRHKSFLANEFSRPEGDEGAFGPSFIVERGIGVYQGVFREYVRFLRVRG
jgi:plasmid stabilization system protein ParE